MREEERKRILGQWGVRGENGRERRERVAVERAVEGSPLRGRPVRPRPQPMGRSVEGYVASMGGPLPYMTRLRTIEDLTDAHRRALERRWQALAAESGGDPTAFRRRWRRVASRWNFSEVNELIHRHNRYYPAESRLPMDPVRGDFALVNGEPYTRKPLDASWVLERFPPILAVATMRV
jgi:hypothetical protein